MQNLHTTNDKIVAGMESPECRYETKLIIKNRFAKNEVTVIPVGYDSFDDDYDNQSGHHYYKTPLWNSVPGVFKNDRNQDWIMAIIIFCTT